MADTPFHIQGDDISVKRSENIFMNTRLSVCICVLSCLVYLYYATMFRISTLDELLKKVKGAIEMLSALKWKDISEGILHVIVLVVYNRKH